MQICKQSGKQCYVAKREAILIVKRIQKRPDYKNRREEGEVYKCQLCGMFHITSWRQNRQKSKKPYRRHGRGKMQ